MPRVRIIAEPRVCHCGKVFSRPPRTSTEIWNRRLDCSRECAGVRRRKETVLKTSEKRRKEVDTREIDRRSEDRKQQQLNKTIDNKTALSLETKILRPGTPEWEAAIQSTTPIGKVRSGVISRAERVSLYGVMGGVL